MTPTLITLILLIVLFYALFLLVDYLRLLKPEHKSDVKVLLLVLFIFVLLQMGGWLPPYR